MTAERFLLRARAARRVGRELLDAFKPLPRQAKMVVAALFMWMLLLTAGVTGVAVKVIATAEKAATLANERASDQRDTAAQSHALCERARVFGVPLGDYFGRVGALDPAQLAAYRRTIPAACPTASTEKAPRAR